MTIRRTLLAGAGLGALALCATPTLAKAPVHHKKAPSASANSALSQQVKALQEQIADLTARLNVQEAAQRETVANVNNAQVAASSAATQAASAQTAASAAQTAASNAASAATKAVPAAVKTELATFSKGKWWDSTTVSGRMYFNFSNISANNNGIRSTAGGAGNPNLNGTGFNIKRFYLGVDHTFSPIFAGNVTMDVANVVGSTSNNNVNTNSAAAPANATALVGKGFYIKKAYLQAKLDPAFIIRLGSADLPWVPYAEGLYGYRHIENTLIDRISYGTSADWGIHVLGDLAKGLISYQVSVVDGGGYRNVKVTNSVDVEGRVSLNYKGFYAGVGGYSGKRGGDTIGNGLPTNPNPLVRHTATRENAIVGYKNKVFNVGAEYFHAKDWNNVATVAEDKADGYSAFGNVNFNKTWSVFGRYDWVKPTKLSNDNLKDKYYNVGIQWEPVKIVDLALVYKRDSVDNGLFGTQNGTIGGANPAGSLLGGHGTYKEIGLFGQLRF
jgi:hypothetical protein